MTKHWKATERRLAKVFKTKRTPLSGGNSGHTRSDTLSPYFFLESKSSKKNAAWSLYLKTRPLARKENKPPAIIYHLDNHPGMLICIHSDDLQEFIRACIVSGVYEDPTKEADTPESSSELERMSRLCAEPDQAQDGAVSRRLPLRHPSGG